MTTIDHSNNPYFIPVFAGGSLLTLSGLGLYAMSSPVNPSFISLCFRSGIYSGLFFGGTVICGLSYLLKSFEIIDDEDGSLVISFPNGRILDFFLPSIPFKNIVAVEKARINLWDGAGIHYMSDDWFKSFYTVANITFPSDAIMLTTQSGEKYKIQAQDPEKLEKIILKKGQLSP